MQNPEPIGHASSHAPSHWQGLGATLLVFTWQTQAAKQLATMATALPQDSAACTADIGSPDDPVHVRFIASSLLGPIYKCAPLVAALATQPFVQVSIVRYIRKSVS